MEINANYNTIQQWSISEIENGMRTKLSSYEVLTILRESYQPPSISCIAVAITALSTPFSLAAWMMRHDLIPNNSPCYNQQQMFFSYAKLYSIAFLTWGIGKFTLQKLAAWIKSKREPLYNEIDRLNKIAIPNRSSNASFYKISNCLTYWDCLGKESKQKLIDKMSFLECCYLSRKVNEQDKNLLWRQHKDFKAFVLNPKNLANNLILYMHYFKAEPELLPLLFSHLPQRKIIKTPLPLKSLEDCLKVAGFPITDPRKFLNHTRSFLTIKAGTNNITLSKIYIPESLQKETIKCRKGQLEVYYEIFRYLKTKNLNLNANQAIEALKIAKKHNLQILIKKCIDLLITTFPQLGKEDLQVVIQNQQVPFTQNTTLLRKTLNNLCDKKDSDRLRILLDNNAISTFIANEGLYGKLFKNIKTLSRNDISFAVDFGKKHLHRGCGLHYFIYNNWLSSPDPFSLLVECQENEECLNYLIGYLNPSQNDDFFTKLLRLADSNIYPKIYRKLAKQKTNSLLLEK